MSRGGRSLHSEVKKTYMNRLVPDHMTRSECSDVRTALYIASHDGLA